MKRLNNKGSILQIVLIIFIIMTFSLTLYLTNIQFTATNYHQIDILMKEKNLEIMLIQFYVNEMKNDILISDDFENEKYVISYTVDDLGDLMEIVTRIESQEFSYTFLVDINVDTYQINQFKYEEG